MTDSAVRRIALPFAALLALFAAAPTASPDQRQSGATTYGYVVESAGNVLYRHLLDQPDTLEPVAPLVSPSQALVVGCETLPGSARHLYCIEALNQAVLFTVDLVDAIVTPVGTASVLPGNLFTALAADPTTGALYATTSAIVTSSLYRIDPGTAALTPVGGITNAAGVTAAAFDAEGQLYAFDAISGDLLAVDKSTGEATVLGATGFVPGHNTSLDFAPDGTCYLWGLSGSSFQSELRTCDTISGATTLVGFLGDLTPGGSPVVTAGAVVLDPLLFADGFESGDTSAWSSAVP